MNRAAAFIDAYIDLDVFMVHFDQAMRAASEAVVLVSAAIGLINLFCGRSSQFLNLFLLQFTKVNILFAGFNYNAIVFHSYASLLNSILPLYCRIFAQSVL